MDAHGHSSSSHNLATYLHPGPGGPFLEIDNEPLKPPSPVTSALLQNNPSLLDLCTFNSVCERYMENNSSPDAGPFKPLVSPSDLYFCLEPTFKSEETSSYSDKARKIDGQSEIVNSPISSVGDCSPNVSSYSSTPCSSPSVNHLVQTESTLTKANQNEIKTNISEDSTKKKRKRSTEKIVAEKSPILRSILLSEQNSDKRSLNHSSNDERDRSPEYVARYSPDYISKNPTETSYRTKFGSNRKPKAKKFSSSDDQNSTRGSLSIKSEECSSIRCSSTSNSNENQSIQSSSNKRNGENSISENFKIKRRRSTMSSETVVQQSYCVSYPENIPRCVDCQTSSAAEISLHLAGCRFQNCRQLKRFEDETYEFEGFTLAVDASQTEIDSFNTANNCSQSALNENDGSYIFCQIARLFCLMFLQEQNERSKFDEKNIVWKRYMPGWREVCDECATTLFNHHYMCRECGLMICIECFDQFSQIPLEKRRKLKRLCQHENSFLLSEFIPWKILLNLRNDSSNYLSRLKLDYTMKLYPASKTENLSAFIRSLKMRRKNESQTVQKVWTSDDSNDDPNIEFFCDGRLPVFNEWKSENSIKIFRKVWSSSCPVLVRNVHENLSRTLWQPSAFKDHMIDHQETPALWDCETLTPVQTNATILNQFWDGFERLDVRLRDDENNGRPRILKLKDWPTKRDFASIFPTRLHDLMKNIPFSDYTRRSYHYENTFHQAGSLNIVERLPNYLVKPDLGPKLYIAYSQLTTHETRKAGTTNLHIDVSDAVNVLVYVGVGGHGPTGEQNEEEIRQVENEILEWNVDQAQIQRLRNGERPGALWHLFRSDDAKKIREYIGRKHRRAPGTDTIHDQSAYLEKEDLIKLREWSNVESYPILQFLGDAVFIPSGAPHQVRNLHSCIKIAEDFVSPENLDRCLITANEFRSLSKTHSNHADILQAKNILYFTTRDALHCLTETNKVPLDDENGHE